MESQARFEGKMEEYYYVRCKKCGRITDFQWQFLSEVSLPEEIKTWGTIEQNNIILQGPC